MVQPRTQSQPQNSILTRINIEASTSLLSTNNSCPIVTTMSNAGLKSLTSPTAQSPVSTAAASLNQTPSPASPNIANSSTKQANKVIVQPAFKMDKDSISPETIAATTTTSATIISSCSGSSSNSSLNPSQNIAKQMQREITSQDVDEVARLFEEKPEAFEKWLMERAPPEALARLHEFIEGRKQPPKRPSVTSDLFQQWMASSPIQVSG